MDKFRPDSFLPLTPIAFEILLALADGERHGYSILQEVEARSGGAVSLHAGTLYRALARLLESEGVTTAVQVTDLARDHRVESALLFNFPEVDAIVCVGGNSTNWTLPPVERVVAANSGLAELLAGPLEIESLNVVGVANQQGASRLRSMVF